MQHKESGSPPDCEVGPAFKAGLKTLDMVTEILYIVEGRERYTTVIAALSTGSDLAIRKMPRPCIFGFCDRDGINFHITGDRAMDL
jgi:hypothetical protein